MIGYGNFRPDPIPRESDVVTSERIEQAALRDAEDCGQARHNRDDYDPHGFTYTPCGNGNACWHWRRSIDCPPDPWAGVA